MANSQTGNTGGIPDHLILTLLIGGCQMIVTMDITTMGVLLPAIGRTFAVEPVILSGLVSFSSLVFASMLLIGGRLSDLIGPKNCVTIGLSIAALGAACGAMASGFAMLLAGRLLFGLGAAMLVPANFSMINTTIPQGPPRARAYGIYGMVQGIALLVGPGLGGVLVSSLGWRAVFWANCAFIVILLGLCRVILPRTMRSEARGFDAPSALMFVPGIVALVVAITGGSGMVTQISHRLGAAIVGVLLLLAFLRRQKTIANPLMPSEIFAWPGVKPGLFGMLSVMAASAGLFLLPPTVMQAAMGFSAAQAGLGMIPHGVTVIVVGQMIGWFMVRYSLTRNVLTGFALLVTGLFINGFMQPQFGYAFNIMIPMIIGAAGSIFTVIMLTAVVTGPVPAHQQGVISAVTFTAQQIGISIGTVALLILAGAPGDPLRASATAFLASAAIALCGLIVAWMSRRGAVVARAV